jgi:aconitate hydratase
MSAPGHDSLNTRRTLTVGDRRYEIFSLSAAAKSLGEISRLPFSLKILLENMLRFEDGRSVTVDHAAAIAEWLKTRSSDTEIGFRPARVLMQDFTGVPAVVDLAAMRDAMKTLGGDVSRINPLVPVDLVIDHSIVVDFAGNAEAFARNVEVEYQRNAERYAFLRWGATAFDNFRVVPPGTGICHQVNVEYLAQVVWTAEHGGKTFAYPDTLVGTDSHTTMVNGVSVLGWGVGGIEAEAAMLGQPVSMVIPEVVGFRFSGRLPEGATATDLVLTVTQTLRKHGVVNKFVEFFGPGLDELTPADMATIANMAPEYGATCGFFPIGRTTLDFLRLTGRDPERVALVEAYAKEQGMWRGPDTPDPVFTATLELDLGTVEPSLAGPKRPQDRIALRQVKAAFDAGFKDMARREERNEAKVAGTDYKITDGDVVIAAITSCTNTSNPHVLVAAGLVARKARQFGLECKPWVKTSFAPGSQVVTDYLARSGLQADLDALGFQLVGYGCTTCIGNSGPLAEPIEQAIQSKDLTVAAVLSGNRNFEGRVHALTKANYLASPPLVVAYALAGSVARDIAAEPLAKGKDGKDVYLKDIWPANREIEEVIRTVVTPEMYRRRYADVFAGDARWAKVQASSGLTYGWQASSTYVQNPPYFTDMRMALSAIGDVRDARILAVLGDSITTDHISPAGSIRKESPAGRYLIEHGVTVRDFNQYGTRRGNHEVMMRGTFANIRIRNELVAGIEGGVTKYAPTGEVMPIYDAAMRYKADKIPLVVFAGKEYGTGSSRDWAAKGTTLLGIRAVIAESFERIHRSNLVGMGVLPLVFPDGTTRLELNLDGSERVDLEGIARGVVPGMNVTCTITASDGTRRQLSLICRIDTLDEVEYFKNGGILQYVLRGMAKAA